VGIITCGAVWRYGCHGVYGTRTGTAYVEISRVNPNLVGERWGAETSEALRYRSAIARKGEIRGSWTVPSVESMLPEFLHKNLYISGFWHPLLKIGAVGEKILSPQSFYWGRSLPSLR